MHAQDDKENIARLAASEGCDYCTSSDVLTYATVHADSVRQGWYSFYVATAATVIDVTFKDRAGAALALTPTWEDVSLPAGCTITAGRITQKKAYIASIQLSAGAIILNKD